MCSSTVPRNELEVYISLKGNKLVCFANSIKKSTTKSESGRSEVFCQACNFIKKETLTQVFSCEFFEIFINTYFYRTPLGAVSGVACFFVVHVWQKKLQQSTPKNYAAKFLFQSALKLPSCDLVVLFIELNFFLQKIMQLLWTVGLYLVQFIIL